jgi:hypothetical protein
VTVVEMEALLAGVDGVIAVPTCRLASNGAVSADGRVDLSPDAIAIGDDHDLRTTVLRGGR